MNQLQLLTPQQIAFFDTFGYIGLPGLLADRAADIIDSFEALFAAHGGGHAGQKHDGSKRSCIVPFVDQSEYLSTLLDDPRINGIATSLLGDDYNYMGSDGNYYVGDTGWHRDGCSDPEVRHIKIAFYLDPVTRDTGSLRVIPGSQRLDDKYGTDLAKTLPRTDTQLGIQGPEVPCIPLETKPGDIVCFNHSTYHAAFGGGNMRRMFTLNMCQKYPDHRLGDLRDYVSVFARFWVDRMYGEDLIRTANPERMRHMQQVMENDGHLAALTAEAKQTMAEPART